jgi:hypothetical protein
MEKEDFTKTSIKQPRELWNKVRSDAVNRNKTNDEILTEILKKHYGVEP